MLPDELPELTAACQFKAEETVAVVIDTLRFCTAASTGLAAGASSIMVVGEVDQAKKLAANHPQSPLLCGERECRPIEGFQLGNSPLEYSASTVRGRDLIFTTTNGTRAVVAASQVATTIVLGTLVNCTAVSRFILNSDAQNLVLLCSGTNGAVAAEDVLAAGAIIDALLKAEPATRVAHDVARIALHAWLSVANNPSKIERALGSATGGRNVLNAGYQQDIAAAARIDTFEVVPCCSNPSESPLRFVAAT